MSRVTERNSLVLLAYAEEYRAEARKMDGCGRGDDARQLRSSARKLVEKARKELKAVAR